MTARCKAGAENDGRTDDKREMKAQVSGEGVRRKREAGRDSDGKLYALLRQKT